MSADGDIIEFGRFRLHRRDRTLLADGRKLDLGARAIEVLLALIDAGGKLVTKDALLDRVWSGVIVEENNLHVQIFALRRALVDIIQRLGPSGLADFRALRRINSGTKR